MSPGAVKSDQTGPAGDVVGTASPAPPISSARVTVRWAAFVIFMICMFVLGAIPRSEASALVAGIAAGMFLAMWWSFSTASSPPRAPRG